MPFIHSSDPVRSTQTVLLYISMLCVWSLMRQDRKEQAYSISLLFCLAFRRQEGAVRPGAALWFVWPQASKLLTTFSPSISRFLRTLLEQVNDNWITFRDYTCDLHVSNFFRGPVDFCYYKNENWWLKSQLQRNKAGQFIWQMQGKCEGKQTTDNTVKGSVWDWRSSGLLRSE